MGIMSRDFSLAEFDQFTGTETWFRHGLVRNVLYTEGARHVAERGGAYWLLDEIALAQRFEPAVRALEDMQCWTLTVAADGSARLRCTDGDGAEVFAKAIPWTDFPLPSVRLWVEGDGETRVILLPSEH
jgi:hypothetical protein